MSVIDWSDSHMVFEFNDYKVVPLYEFESAWSSFESSHAVEPRKDGYDRFRVARPQYRFS